jgi:putative methionine-R-sulfoxide reductase with GAF domain
MIRYGGVIDIDSTQLDAFDEKDQAGLESLAAVLSEKIKSFPNF